MGGQVSTGRLQRAGVFAAAIVTLVACGSGAGTGSPPSAASVPAADEADTLDVEVSPDTSDVEVSGASVPATATVASTSTIAATTAVPATVATTAPVPGSAVVTVVDIGAARAAVDSGATIGRQWTATALLAWTIDLDGDAGAPQDTTNMAPGGVAVVGDQLPAELAGAAFELATAAGRPPVGLGTEPILAVAGLVGDPAGVEACDAEPPANIVCASLTSFSNTARAWEYAVYDHADAAGTVEVTTDVTGAWQIATWIPAAPPVPVTVPRTVASTRPTVVCDLPNEPPYHFPIQRGDSGPDVRAIQELLILNGFDVGASGADGHFGPATEAALRAYHGSGMTVGRAGARAGAACMEDLYVLTQLTESEGEDPNQ